MAMRASSGELRRQHNKGGGGGDEWDGRQRHPCRPGGAVGADERVVFASGDQKDDLDLLLKRFVGFLDSA